MTSYYVIVFIKFVGVAHLIGLLIVVSVQWLQINDLRNRVSQLEDNCNHVLQQYTSQVNLINELFVYSCYDVQAGKAVGRSDNAVHSPLIVFQA